MRVDRPHDRLFARLFGFLLVLAGGGLGALLGGIPGAGAGMASGLAGGFGLEWQAGRRARKRRRALASPFPARWRELLERDYDHYNRLPRDLRAVFEDSLRIFLAEVRITGIEVEATEELKLLVAASAVTLSLGWPDYEWDQLTEVLLYPRNFDRDYRFTSKSDRVGEAPGWGTVILSVPALRESFEDPDDAFHVGIHEFVHLLDVDQARDGIPLGLPAARRREWVEVMERERERLRRGKSVMDPYGADEPEEFLGVAVEAFFEVPLLLRRRHHELYAMLRDCFRQDPAAWDDERGLVYR